MMLGRVLTLPLIIIQRIFYLEFSSKTVFLENSNKKDDMSDEFENSVSLKKGTLKDKKCPGTEKP